MSEGGIRILKISSLVTLAGAIVAFSPVFYLILNPDVSKSFAPVMLGAFAIGIPVALVGVVGMFHGYRKDKKYLEENYGETPSARPIKSAGLYLYLRQRKRIVEGD